MSRRRNIFQNKESGIVADDKEMERFADEKKNFKVYWNENDGAGMVSFHEPGSTVQMRDGTMYEVQEDGSIKRILVKKEVEDGRSPHRRSNRPQGCFR